MYRVEAEDDAGGKNVSSVESPPASVERLFGDEVPFPDPDESGVEVYALSTNDFFANVTGGAHRGGGVIGNALLSVTLDTGVVGMWNSGKIVAEGIGIYGRQPSSVVGDYEYSSSIDGPDTVELYEFFYEHVLLNDRLSILAGIHDYTIDFAVTEYGWDFINSSFWTPATMTQYFFSFYPTTGLGTRAKLQVSDDIYMMAGVYDGNATDQDQVRKVAWGLNSTDGALSLGEVGVAQSREEERPYKVAMGGWYNSGRFASADGGFMHSNWGSYLVGQMLLWSEDANFKRGLGGFFQIGQAAPKKNFNTWYFGGGLRYQGPFTSRDNDVVGVGLTYARIGEVFREANPGTDLYEGVIEVMYRASVTDYVALTPSVQYISNPGASSDLNDAVVLYLRTEVVL
jgi:porin